jgi:hypothetical protein
MRLHWQLARLNPTIRPRQKPRPNEPAPIIAVVIVIMFSTFARLEDQNDING